MDKTYRAISISPPQIGKSRSSRCPLFEHIANILMTEFVSELFCKMHRNHGSGIPAWVKTFVQKSRIRVAQATLASPFLFSLSVVLTSISIPLR